MHDDVRAQLQRALSGLLGRAHSTQQAPQPTDALRNDFVQRIQQARDPMLLVVHWGAPPSDAAHTGLHAVVALRGEVAKVVEQQLGAVARPSQIHFVGGLPKTRSGKVLRRALQAVAERRDPGDLTTMEDPAALQQVKALVEA